MAVYERPTVRPDWRERGEGKEGKGEGGAAFMVGNIALTPEARAKAS